MDLSITLLREKFVISDGRGEHAEGHPIVAVSNRLVVPLLSANGQVCETFVVRAQTMHACIRMAAQIIQTFMRAGPLMARAESFRFADAWDFIIEDHERAFNPERWVAVYNNGTLIFEAGRHHAFLDMVEKCDGKNSGDYERSIGMAENAFASMGKQVTISHEGHIGLVATVKQQHGKCGLILRNPNRRTTFNYMADNKEGGSVSPVQCLSVAAAFLEGIQLAFQIGMANEKLRLDLIPRSGEEARKAESGRRRLGRLSAEIRTFENSLSVRYRPEKPEFAQTVIEAELFARDIFRTKAEKEQA